MSTADSEAEAWVPDESFVQAAYVRFRTTGLSVMQMAHGAPQREAVAEFERWLDSVKAEARNEGTP